MAAAIVPDTEATIGGKKKNQRRLQPREPHLQTAMTHSSRLRNETSQSRIGSRHLPDYIGKQNHHCSKRRIRTTHELHNHQRRNDFTAPLGNQTNEQSKKNRGKETRKAHVRRRSIVLTAQIWSSEASTY